MKIRFPKLDYAEIPGTGHFLMLEKPNEFNRLPLSFLFRKVLRDSIAETVHHPQLELCIGISLFGTPANSF